MRKLISMIVLMGPLTLAGCGGGDPNATAVTKLDLTPEQAAAIKKQDEAIGSDEGGPQKVTKPGKPAR